VLAEVRRGGKVADDQVHWAARWALRLAEATSEGKWLDLAFALWGARGAFPSSDEQVSQVEQIVQRADRIDMRGFLATLDAWRSSSLTRPRYEVDRFQRIEALFGTIARKGIGPS
jgi:hypothetical protein